MKIIGLTGKAGCGKDTVADHLVAKHFYHRFSFAGPLKRGLCAMFEWDPKKLDDREWKEARIASVGKSPRELMQTLGTEWGRDIVHPDLWLIIMRKQLEKIAHFERVSQKASMKLVERRVVISDVRFDNEAALLRSMGGSIVHMLRDTPGVAPHKSESGVILESADIILSNQGTVAELLHSVDLRFP